MNPELIQELTVAYGLTEEQVKGIAELGVVEKDDMKLLEIQNLINAGLNVVQAQKILKGYAPATPLPTATTPVDPNAEIPEGSKPTATMLNQFALSTGMDPGTLMMMFMGGGNVAEMDLTGIIPVKTMVEGYNPKVRNMYLTVLGKVEDRHGVPIIVINSNGSVNQDLTIQYITGLDEGRDPAENNIYYDSEATPFEIIGVGVDAQSIYDADPVNPTKALQQNGMGKGLVNWTKVPLEVRQVAYYAANQTGEIKADQESDLTWLRDNIKAGVGKLVFSGKAPKAVSAFNAAHRTGSLPTLRVMLSRSPRKPETGPRRRALIRPGGIGDDSSL